jgi:O-antigen/teichoic acid export membrane protein
MGRARPVGIALLGAQCIAVALLLLLVRVPEDVVRVPLIQLFADLVAAGFLLAPLLGRAWLHPRFSEALHLVKSAGLITLSRTLRTLIVTIDVVMLGFMTSSEQVGLYSAAYRIVFFVMAIVYASHIAWLPPVTRAIAEGRSPDGAFSGALRLSLTVSVPFVVGGFMIAPHLLRAIFGAEFAPAATALQLLLVSLFFVALHGASRNLFLAYDRLGVESWIMAAGVVVNVILNLILIPRFGLNGAAFATAAADGAILALCAIAIAHFGVRPALRLLLVPLFAGAAMAVALWLVGVDRAAFVSIIVGGIVYAGALAALTRLSRDWFSNTPVSSAGAAA